MASAMDFSAENEEAELKEVGFHVNIHETNYHIHKRIAVTGDMSVRQLVILLVDQEIGKLLSILWCFGRGRRPPIRNFDLNFNFGVFQFQRSGTFFKTFFDAAKANGVFFKAAFDSANGFVLAIDNFLDVFCVATA